MRLAAIACRVFTRELSAAVAKCAHPVEVSWLPQGLHDTPDLLRARINGTIDAIERADAEAPARAMETAGELLADPARRTLLARNIAALAVPDAAERIVDEIEKIW